MNMRRIWSRIAATAALSLLPFSGTARASAEYESSEVMIPVRDGVKLHTLLLRPKGDERAAADPAPEDALWRAGAGTAGADSGPAQAPGRRRLRLRVPGHPRPLRLRGERSSSSGPRRPLGPEGRRRDDRRVRYCRLAGQERGRE